MSDYSPVYLPGHEISATTSAAVTGGQLVEVSGDGTVGPASAASPKVVGVAAFDCGSGARATVISRGVVHETTASGAITAGDQVAAVATGKVAAVAAASGTPDAAAVNTARSVLGVAMTTAADAALVRWMQV